MRRWWVFIATVAVALIVASTAVAQPAQTITATGNGQAKVLLKDRHSNASIAAAYDAAKKVAIGAALSNAHEYAQEYASGTGLTLGSVVSVSDATNSFYGPGPFGGPFGPGQFCGTIRRPIFKKVNGKRRVVRFKKEHHCFVPSFAFVSLTVTYSAS